MKIEAHRDRCIGAGMCALTAPEVFEQDSNDGLVVVVNETPGADSTREVEDAVALCPSGALSILEEPSA